MKKFLLLALVLLGLSLASCGDDPVKPEPKPEQTNEQKAAAMVPQGFTETSRFSVCGFLPTYAPDGNQAIMALGTSNLKKVLMYLLNNGTKPTISSVNGMADVRGGPVLNPGVELNFVKFYTNGGWEAWKKTWTTPPGVTCN